MKLVVYKDKLYWQVKEVGNKVELENIHTHERIWTYKPELYNPISNIKKDANK